MGMVFSFAVAILVASRSVSRQVAFAIFVGSSSLHGAVAQDFVNGLHAAFYFSVVFMVIAAVLIVVSMAPGVETEEALKRSKAAADYWTKTASTAVPSSPTEPTRITTDAS